MQNLIDKIIEASSLERRNIENRIEEKKKELPGVSEEGITRLVAKELGVDLLRPEPKELKIKNIVPNMRNITFLGKITGMQPVREFHVGDNIGRVQNITLEDDTGRIRISLWNDEIDKFSLGIGDVVKIDNSRIKKDNFGNPEARISYGGNIIKSDIEIELKPPKDSFIGLEEGDDVSLTAIMIHVFERPLIYYFCPKCRSRIINSSCTMHGVVEPNKTMIVSGVLDDGNSTTNAVFFGNVAESLMRKKIEEVEEELKKMSIEEFIKSVDILTKKFKIEGIVKRNQLTDDLEIRIKSVERE
jgi:replication factor A1